jgi:exopolyphosphatase/guanosine-5'-triphosphate,3'-diphosphate pyrophosphatase
MVIDIGGGSTEIVTGDHHDIDFKISMNIGAVRMTERFLKRDPVDQDEENQMRKHCREVIERSLQQVQVTDYNHIIGVAGTTTTLAAMIQRMPVYKPEKIDGFKIIVADLKDQIYRLKVLTIDKRKLLDGLEPKRADVIFAGAVIMEELLQFFNLPQITTSNFGLRYGMILKTLNS